MQDMPESDEHVLWRWKRPSFVPSIVHMEMFLFDIMTYIDEKLELYVLIIWMVKTYQLLIEEPKVEFVIVWEPLENHESYSSSWHNDSSWQKD